jgi:hypothetical protein
MLLLPCTPSQLTVLKSHVLTISPSNPPAGDFRVAKAYDFDAAQSPRAAYHTRDAPFLASPPPSPEDASPNKVGSPMWVAPQGDQEQEDLLVSCPTFSLPFPAADAGKPQVPETCV